MGYSYGINPNTGRSQLACDSCGAIGGVRKRTCPHKVLGDSIHSMDGRRHALPYCPAPALCSPCFRAEGGTKGLHAQCETPAAQAQAKADAREARWQAGDWRCSSGYGIGDMVQRHLINISGERLRLTWPRDLDQQFRQTDWMTDQRARAYWMQYGRTEDEQRLECERYEQARKASA